MPTINLALSPEIIEAFGNEAALQPPPGVQSNFNNPPSNRLMFLTVAPTMMGIMTVFLATRFYVKIWIKRHFSWDDGKYTAEHVWKCADHYSNPWTCCGNLLSYYCHKYQSTTSYVKRRSSSHYSTSEASLMACEICL